MQNHPSNTAVNGSGQRAAPAAPRQPTFVEAIKEMIGKSSKKGKKETLASLVEKHNVGAA